MMAVVVAVVVSIESKEIGSPAQPHSGTSNITAGRVRFVECIANLAAFRHGKGSFSQVGGPQIQIRCICFQVLSGSFSCVQERLASGIGQWLMSILDDPEYWYIGMQLGWRHFEAMVEPRRGIDGLLYSPHELSALLNLGDINCISDGLR
jgi:hypothetical protein